jgi:hypothetical protein
MISTKKKLRLPVIATVLLLSAFVFGTLSGAFMYATGKAVVEMPKMFMVSHTEYRYSEPGQIIARLVDFQGNPVVVNNCTATILYPDKTFFVNSALMTATGNISGDYYYAFTTPAGPEGTYEYQATCTYAAGTKTASVTNSFHLSSAFTSVLGNLTFIESEIDLVQGNLTELSSQVSAVNASLAGQITDLSSQLNANTTQILTAISEVNGSLYQAIQNINVSVNLTPVLDAISALDTAMAGNFTYTNSLITAVNESTQTSFGMVFSDLGQINTTANNIYSLLETVNQTTSDTYTYMTTTLSLKVDDALAALGVINATVNRIETTTSQINATTNTILQNQEDAVQMTVFSG